MVPRKSVCTPAMIFISVLLPAPFSPTIPCTSPPLSMKSTSASASTPPNDFEIPESSRIGLVPLIPVAQSRGGGARRELPARAVHVRSDQEMAFHPHDARRVWFGDDRPVGDDIFRNAALAGLLSANHCRYAGNDGAAMDAARRVAHGREHAAVQDRVERRRHCVDAADFDLRPVVLLHHIEAASAMSSL